MVTKRPHIVGICGSLREDSLNKALLSYVGTLFPEHFQFSIADISSIPLYNQDLESDLPPSVLELVHCVKSADAIVFSTPEYNHSIPGVLKNALDWLSRPAAGTPLAMKPAAILGATPGRLGTVRAQAHLRDILFALNMTLVTRPEVLIGEANTKFDKDGTLIDETSKKLVGQLIENLVHTVLRSL